MAYLAPCLVQGRAEVDARWPGRDRRSDGWIGDAAHASGVSDHNPDRATGVVRATDTDASGIDPMAYVRACIRHPSTRYVIFNRTIWSESTGFAARAYTGSNPHTSHVHRSIKHTRTAENSTVRLDLGSKTLGGPPPFLRTLIFTRGRPLMVGADVRTWQQKMCARGWRLGVDGEFGPECDEVARKFQREKGLDVDGEVGPKTWAATWNSPVT